MDAKKVMYLTLGSHMDLHWMAPPRDCLDRGCDIINRALKLCEQYPEYCFYIETTVFTEYYLSRFPQNKAVLQKLMDDGRLEIAACYVDRFEHVYSGESIARHHIVGQRYLRETFGRGAKGTCHSDLPGMSPQVPQICKLADIAYYIRARGPLGMYRWQAPDGSEILYASVGYTYSRAEEWRVKREIEHETMDTDGKPLNAYLMRGGYSDLEMPDDQIVHDVNRFHEMYPEIEFTIASPFKAVQAYTTDREKLPILSGEWPFGWGSPTSGFVEHFLSSVRIENGLLSLEKLEAAVRFLGGDLSAENDSAAWWVMLGRFKGDAKIPVIMPGKELYEAWRGELFTQDHNHMGFGGSKTEMDRRIIQTELFTYMNKLKDRGLNALTSHLPIPGIIDGHEVISGIPVFNSLSWQRDALVTLPARLVEAEPCRLVDADGEAVSLARVGQNVSFMAKALPGTGYKVYYLVKGEDEPHAWLSWHETGERLCAENAFFRIEVDKRTGTVPVWYDKRLHRQLAGFSDASRFLEMISLEESGTDVVYNFTGGKVRDSEGEVKVYLGAFDAVSAKIVIETSMFRCPITKQVTLYREQPQVGIDIDLLWWGMKNQSVRLCMPLAYEGYRETRYGVPYYNMRWPEMMHGIDDKIVLGADTFNPDEVDAYNREHLREVEKWVDIGYENSGVTFGTSSGNFYIANSYLEAVLLRTKVSCGDPHIFGLNQGEHRWHFALRPHEGNWAQSAAARFGWETVTPAEAAVLAPKAGHLPQNEASFVSVDKQNIIVSAVKPAYDDPSQTVVRLFETNGEACTATLTFAGRPKSCQIVNLLEDEGEALECGEHSVTLPIRAFEIVTVKLHLN